jgi:hypothetical protein
VPAQPQPKTVAPSRNASERQAAAPKSSADNAAVRTPSDDAVGMMPRAALPAPTTSVGAASDPSLQSGRDVIRPLSNDSVRTMPSASLPAPPVPVMPAPPETERAKAAGAIGPSVAADEPASGPFGVSPRAVSSPPSTPAAPILPVDAARTTHASEAAPRRKDVERPPPIRVSIGRITVDAPPAAAPSPPFRRPAPTLSLNSYLDRRRRSQ